MERGYEAGYKAERTIDRPTATTATTTTTVVPDYLQHTGFDPAVSASFTDWSPGEEWVMPRPRGGGTEMGVVATSITSRRGRGREGDTTPILRVNHLWFGSSFYRLGPSEGSLGVEGREKELKCWSLVRGQARGEKSPRVGVWFVVGDFEHGLWKRWEHRGESKGVWSRPALVMARQTHGAGTQGLMCEGLDQPPTGTRLSRTGL